MRLGGFFKSESAEEQAAKALSLGYAAIGVDPKHAGSTADRKHYAEVVKRHSLLFAEIGAWSNPISSQPGQRKLALETCKQRLALADEMGARCCVNISGSRGQKWDGPHPLNLTSETFEMIVQSVREIIDAVKPARTYYTLETMPWMYPHSADSYLALINAIDRKAFAVHFDPVNLVCSPEIAFNTAALSRDFVAKLGPHIQGVHVKDIKIGEKLTVHLDECRAGLGLFDHATLFRELSKLDPDLPVMLEHLPEEEYPLAAKHLRAVAAEAGVTL